MFNKKHTDICVSGAGPVGLVAAHTLADKGVEFVLFDTAAGPHTHSYALALLPETLELLEGLGVVDEVLTMAHQVPMVALYHGTERKAELNYASLDSPYPFLAVIPQCDLELILIHALQVKGHRPFWHHRVRYINEYDDHLDVEVDRIMQGMTGYAYAHIEMQIDKIMQYRCNYVIGADGHRSAARRVAGIEFEETSPPQSYAVFEFKTDVELPNEMRIIIDEQGTHIFWPMANNYCRWSFEVDLKEAQIETMNKEHCLVYTGKHAFPLLDEAHLAGYMSQHARWFEGTADAMRWRMLVRFEKRMAASFGRDRIWLAGDAAHLTTPGGMLSMNVGMHEAYDLAQRLSLGTDELRQDAVGTYTSDRMDEWSDLLCLDHVLHGDSADPWIQEHQHDLTTNLPASGDTRRELLEQVHLEPIVL